MNMDNRDQIFMGIHMLPEDYLCPIKYYTGKKKITAEGDELSNILKYITRT